MSEEAAGVAAADVAAAERLIGLEFTDAERELLLQGLQGQRDAYLALRGVDLPNAVPPALRFDPRLPGMTFDAPPVMGNVMRAEPVVRPDDLEEVAFWPIMRLAALLRSRQVTARALTEMYLRRLKRYDPILHCVVTLTEDLALRQADQADAEIAAGEYRGPLHGIPWGAKDLLATRDIRTTWGAEPYIEQIFDYNATVVERLTAAGAVLVAKLTLGALAWGDVWFGGMTRNPWNTEEGASGSSAGSASATAAGLVGFSIGSETWGSIVSPGVRCGATGLRPTFGRVSRHGAMALSWTMDKLGPLCRTVEDCALVFAAIHGADGNDPTAVDMPFNWQTRSDLHGVRLGYVEKEFAAEHDHKDMDDRALDVLRGLGAELVPIAMPDYPVEALGIILNAEAAAAFDDLTRSNRDDMLARQVVDAWPNAFRLGRLIPAVEYIQANRIRTLVMAGMSRVMADVDAYVVPALSDNLLLTNLTGHPSVVLPHGFKEAGTPHGITFVGRLYDEAGLLAIAKVYQDATDYHLAHPMAALQAGVEV